MLALKMVPGGRVSAKIAVAFFCRAVTMLEVAVASNECCTQRIPTSSV
jgi:hypothetical protein